jgi:hypothetical protein
MQAVHEFGHVLAAWITGGVVVGVVLHPLTISRTDLAQNPMPLAVVWTGPIVGVLLPLLLAGLAQALKLPGSFVLRFFAGFCLIANGLYIGIGSFAAIGDCGEMLRHGSPVWVLWLFGMATTPFGFWLWNGEGKHFGLGKQPAKVELRLAYSVSAVVIMTLILECLLSGR